MSDDRNLEAFRPVLESAGTELNEPAYVAPGDSAIQVDLAIDRLFAQIPDVSKEEREHIETLLRALRSRQLPSWLRWAHEHEWTGQRLLTFLKFWEVWGANPLWWEISYWDYLMNCWRPSYNRANLTRDMAYLLVCARAEHGLDKVIDPDWHEKWVSHPERQMLFPSFAAYAYYCATGNDVSVEASGAQGEDEYLEVSGWDEYWLWADAQSQGFDPRVSLPDLGLSAKERNYDG